MEGIAQVADRISIGESQGQIVQTRIVPTVSACSSKAPTCFHSSPSATSYMPASKITFADFSFLAIGSSVWCERPYVGCDRCALHVGTLPLLRKGVLPCLPLLLAVGQMCGGLTAP
jgi:hypothetical protein